MEEMQKFHDEPHTKGCTPCEIHEKRKTFNRMDRIYRMKRIKKVSSPISPPSL
jgi:hypothetical protein